METEVVDLTQFPTDVIENILYKMSFGDVVSMSTNQFQLSKSFWIQYYTRNYIEFYIAQDEFPKIPYPEHVKHLEIWSNEYISSNMLPFNIFSALEELKLNKHLLQNDTIPRELPASIKKLDMSWNNMYNLPNDCFIHLTNLSELNLGDNNITRIPRRLPRSIKKLDMSWNCLFYLPTDSFADLTNLCELDLSGNNFREMPKNLPPNLKKLKMRRNDLSIIQGDFRQYQHLTEIDIKSNCIKQISAKFPPNIKKLDLSFNFPTHFDFLKCLHLKELVLVSVKLTHIPVLNSSVTILDLSDNEIVYIGQKLEKLTNLEDLNLSMNKIKIFTKQPLTFNNLKKLSLAKNKLKIAPILIAPVLTHLNLSINSLSHFDATFYKNLVDLDLSHNNLEEIPVGLSLGLQNLNLGYNSIARVSNFLIKHAALKCLILRCNDLLFFPHFLSKSIVSLDVRSNKKIKNITRKNFGHYRNLLFLNNCEIELI